MTTLERIESDPRWQGVAEMIRLGGSADYHADIMVAVDVLIDNEAGFFEVVILASKVRANVIIEQWLFNELGIELATGILLHESHTMHSDKKITILQIGASFRSRDKSVGTWRSPIKTSLWMDESGDPVYAEYYPNQMNYAWSKPVAKRLTEDAARFNKERSAVRPMPWSNMWWGINLR